MRLFRSNALSRNHAQVPVAPHFELGRRGEVLAIEHHRRAGYRIVAANFNIPIGRNRRDALVKAEIDVVAYDGPDALPYRGRDPRV